MRQEWERCTPWLEAALHRGGDTLTLAEVKHRIAMGQYQFWPALDSAVVTQVIRGVEDEFNILLAGGNLQTLQQMLPHLERYGRDMGCSLVTVLGRRGWERTFLCREAGYRPVATLYGKRLHEQGSQDTHRDQPGHHPDAD